MKMSLSMLCPSRPMLALWGVCLGVPLAVSGSASADNCPNAAFRTGPGLHLPDCRAYEMVSPSGATDGAKVGAKAWSPDGSAFMISANEAFAGAQANVGLQSNYYAMTPGESGWTPTPLAPPASQFTAPAALQGDLFATSLDTHTTLWVDRGASQPNNSLEIYRESSPGDFTEVGPLFPPTAPPSKPELVSDISKLAGISADGSHVLVSMRISEDEAANWPFDRTQPRFKSLLEYVGTGNTAPLLVGVDDSGNQISQCETKVGGGLHDQGENTHNAVSADGNIVFFTAFPAGSECSRSAPPVTELFARIDNGLPDAHTVAISEPTATDCAMCDTEAGVLAEAIFEGASEDGSKVFFRTKQPLLGGDTSSNLYEYDFDAPAGEKVVRVSGGDATVPNPTAGVEGRAPQVAEDGSHVYFVATGVLTTTPNGQEQTAHSGADNLYMFERDSEHPGGHVAFVVDLCSDADASGSVSDSLCPSNLNGLQAGIGRGGGGGLNPVTTNDRPLWTEDQWQAGSNVTPNGRFLVFTSYGDLTPDDTSGVTQVFEYDAQAGTLIRVSIGQNGFNNDGNSTVATVSEANGARIKSPLYENSDEPGTYWNHLSVSADGSHVFFESPDALTPQALNFVTFGLNNFNEVPYIQNIYEYHEGNVYLISDGQDISHNITGLSLVALDGTDASGSDVFFTTADGLSPQDDNGHVDVYDARINGGFPAPSVPLGCASDACQGGLSGTPVLLSPGSEFQAGGNAPLAAPKPAMKSKAKTKPKARGKPKAKKKRKVRGKSKKGKATKSGRIRHIASRTGGRS